MKIFHQEIQQLTTKEIPGDIVFKLYDTYGFPMDLTADIAREHELSIDEEGFHKEMNQQRGRSQAASKFAGEYTSYVETDDATHFTGYDYLRHDAKITGLFLDNKAANIIKKGQKAILILDKTPFYAESGGQVGDQGILKYANNEFMVHDTQKQGDSILHMGEVAQGEFKLNDKLDAIVNKERRNATAYNHSATHLLNAALRHLLGEHVLQKGSLVDPERLRFDFSHFEPLHKQQLIHIENLVNTHIRANHHVETKVMTPEEAMDSGAMALFGEKYGEEVRVLCMGDFSMELCGGTHVHRTGDMGLFKIISEAGIAAGIRRIEAVTGQAALDYMQRIDTTLQDMSTKLNVKVFDAPKKLQQVMDGSRQLEKEVARLKAKLASGVGTDLSSEAKDIKGVKVLTKILDDADAKTLRETMDKLKDKLGSSVVLLACVNDDKVNLVAGVSKDLTQKIKAGDIMQQIAKAVDGKGGGRPDMAQGGGTNPKALPKSLEKVYQMVEEAI